MQLNCHGPGLAPTPVARLPVQPGNSDLCFEWPGPIADAKAHLQAHGVAIELGPVERHAARGDGHQPLLPRSRRLAAGIHLVRPIALDGES